MQYLSDAEQQAFDRWLESPGQEWTADADRVHCQQVWRKVTGRLREPPPRARRFRMPTGVRVALPEYVEREEPGWHEAL